MEFIFSKKAKTAFMVMMLIGLVALIVGFITDTSYHHNRFWANILINGFFFLGISVGALFFITLQNVTESSYMIVLKRVFEGISSYIYWGAGIVLIVVIAALLGFNHIYHWMDPSTYTKVLEDGTANPDFDPIIYGKRPWLNEVFFAIRTILTLVVWCWFANVLRKRSLEEDELGGTSFYYKNRTLSAIFLVFFGFTSTSTAFDWIMSIDTHWFSTLFGWYVFSGIWVSAMIMIVLLTIYLQSRGYLKVVNKSHIHDLGKWMFACSFLWSYLWFSQFMLIWYSNMPEDVVYFVTRVEHYPVLFFGMFFVNFVFPMVILMARNAKRMVGYLIFVGGLIFIGHWLDVYMLIMPGSVGTDWHIGFLEIGGFIGFLGLFLFIVFNALTKAPLVVKNHPYLEESKHLHI